MRKVFLLVAAIATLAFGEFRMMPQNVRPDTVMVRVAANETAYTRLISFANQTYKSGKIIIIDSTIASQESLDVGDGVQVWQQGCRLFGNIFGVSEEDTLCDLCGDTILIDFDNASGLTADSLVCATMDTTSMSRYRVGIDYNNDGAGDSVWVSNGYFVPVVDPDPFTRFKVTAASGFGASKKWVMIILWSFFGQPVQTDQ